MPNSQLISAPSIHQRTSRPFSTSSLTDCKGTIPTPMIVSSGVMLYVFLVRTEIAWTWYVFMGSVITFVVSWLASFAFEPASAEMGDELSL